MNTQLVKDISGQLKELARGLSFLGHPRYPLKELYLLFPQHKIFIDALEDVSVPFNVNADEKKLAMDELKTSLLTLDLPGPLKKIFQGRIEDYEILLSMMENFGNESFYKSSKKLYGSSDELLRNNGFLYFLEEIPKDLSFDESIMRFQGEEALTFLKDKLLETFDESDFEVKPSHSLLSDSSAGRRVLKLNTEKEYTQGHLDIFLVHEGWVHLGTSINGQRMEEHPWLSTWAPRTTFLQEGLAILMELITGVMTRERWNKVILRHLATTMAERGSSISEVYEYLRHHEMEDLDAFKLALRIFRGVPFEGGMAFTKELLYLHGLVRLLTYLELGKVDLKTLWAGKLSFDEHRIFMEHYPCEIKYFPKALLQDDVQERLLKIKKLSLSLGF